MKNQMEKSEKASSASDFLKIYIFYYYYYFWKRQLKSDKNEGRETRGMTCSKGPQVGFEPWATVARTEPFYMVDALPTEQTNTWKQNDFYC